MLCAYACVCLLLLGTRIGKRAYKRAYLACFMAYAVTAASFPLLHSIYTCRRRICVFAHHTYRRRISPTSTTRRPAHTNKETWTLPPPHIYTYIHMHTFINIYSKETSASAFSPPHTYHYSTTNATRAIQTARVAKYQSTSTHAQTHILTCIHASLPAGGQRRMPQSAQRTPHRSRTHHRDAVGGRAGGANQAAVGLPTPGTCEK